MSWRTVQDMFHKAKAKAGVTKHVTVHTLRHDFATHLHIISRQKNTFIHVFNGTFYFIASLETKVKVSLNFNLYTNNFRKTDIFWIVKFVLKKHIGILTDASMTNFTIGIKLTGAKSSDNATIIGAWNT